MRDQGRGLVDEAAERNRATLARIPKLKKKGGTAIMTASIPTSCARARAAHTSFETLRSVFDPVQPRGLMACYALRRGRGTPAFAMTGAILAYERLAA